MDLFRIAKVVTLHNQRAGKYLVAKDKKMKVRKAGKGSSRNARWSVELVPNSQSLISLKSCDNNCLTASNKTDLSRFRMGGLKVRLTKPHQRLDNVNSIKWEPIREGTHSNQVIKLKTQEGTYLRACSTRQKYVNHERNADIQDEILWEVEILEITLEAASTYYNLAPPAFQKLARDYFESMDEDRDGKVSIDEFVKFFNQFDSSMDRSFFAALDENGDGSLEFLEVFRLHYMLNRPQARPFVESLQANVQQPGAQDERVKRRAKTLLAFLTVGIQIAALAAGCAC
ncbi:uncharacterized protein LOC132176947 isoform X1 [Corylus avellana]|uniref:uncharacterized protein LOC132176947 isoform X1 n=1 Tax=Corylus avellana TaxID=13451 RepID=UPI00286B26EE|nr:uncharacterized protein LOC132176947 isoform X1 [Corylus avellana]